MLIYDGNLPFLRSSALKSLLAIMVPAVPPPSIKIFFIILLIINFLVCCDKNNSAYLDLIVKPYDNCHNMITIMKRYVDQH